MSNVQIKLSDLKKFEASADIIAAAVLKGELPEACPDWVKDALAAAFKAGVEAGEENLNKQLIGKGIVINE